MFDEVEELEGRDSSRCSRLGQKYPHLSPLLEQKLDSVHFLVVPHGCSSFWCALKNGWMGRGCKSRGEGRKGGVLGISSSCWAKPTRLKNRSWEDLEQEGVQDSPSNSGRLLIQPTGVDALDVSLSDLRPAKSVATRLYAETVAGDDPDRAVLIHLRHEARCCLFVLQGTTENCYIVGCVALEVQEVG